jgi:lipoyl(octanoyl) transferase
VRDLEEVLILTLADYGVTGEPALSPRPVGVWVGDRKIASLGIHLRHWVTTHGFALNIATDLSFFSGIVACGMESAPMTSIEELTGNAPSLEDVAQRVMLHFADVFGRAPRPLQPAEIEALADLAAAGVGPERGSV